MGRENEIANQINEDVFVFVLFELGKMEKMEKRCIENWFLIEIDMIYSSIQMQSRHIWLLALCSEEDNGEGKKARRNFASSSLV